MKKFPNIIFLSLIFMAFLYANEVPALTGDSIKDALINEYKSSNEKLPSEKISIIDILNSSNLYTTMTGTELKDTDKGILNKLIKVIDILEEEGSVLVTLKLQGKFYPEGTFKYEYQAQEQRQRFIDVLIPIIEDKMLDEQEMLDSIHIFDTVPYFTLKLNKENFWKLLNSKGIVDLELVELDEPELAQSSPLIGATTAWSNGADGQGQVVAVLDTGVRKTHQFLTGKVVSEACYSNAGGYGSGSTLCPGGGTSKTSSGSGVNCNTSFSACNHGTHVAGIIAGKSASFSGVAKEAKILAIQVFTNIGGKILSYTTDQQRGLERVYALRNTYNIASANMSLGGGKYTAYCNSNSRKSIIDNLLSVGIATVIASGNDGYTNAVGAPGCIQTAVTVGATSDGGWGRAVDSVDSYSNSASMVDILAPGSAIYSSTAGSNSTYSTYQGTSMATPQVAGAFAVLKSVNNSLTVTQALSILQSTGKSVKDSKNNITRKRINVNAAVGQLGSADVTVTISPAGATSDGGQWSINGSSWQNSGATVSSVLLGTHSIIFKGIINSDNTKIWQTPTSLSINIASDGDNTSEDGIYIESDKLSVPRDFDDDGRSDVLMRSAKDGRHLLMLMNGAELKAGTIVTKNGSHYKVNYGAWSSRGIGDFNGDGKSDILMRNTRDGRHLIMLMNGTTMLAGTIVTKNGSHYKVNYGAWSSRGIGDFNGDGKSDILMRNTRDGRHLIMLMNGTTMLAGTIVTKNGLHYKVNYSTWVSKGIGDFNGDGKSDILMRNTRDGRHLIMLMNGTTMLAGTIVTKNGSHYKVNYGAWSSRGIGDFNGDGKSDILMRNKKDGRHLIMLMNGTTMTSGTIVTKSNSHYKVNYSTWASK